MNYDLKTVCGILVTHEHKDHCKGVPDALTAGQEDLPDAKKAFDAMSVNDKLNFIGGLIAESKGVQGGNAIWGATLGQLGGGDLSYTMAGVARMNNYKSTQGDVS